MERLSGLEVWQEKEVLNDLSNTELIQFIIDAQGDCMENPYRVFETIGASTIAAQILVSRGFLMDRIYD